MNMYIIGGIVVVAILALVFFRKKSVAVAQKLIKQEMPIVEKDIPTILDKVYSNFPKSLKVFVTKNGIESFIKDEVKSFTSDEVKNVMSNVASSVATNVTSDVSSELSSVAGNVESEIKSDVENIVSGNSVSGNS